MFIMSTEYIYTVYKTTNIINQKIYIGVHKTQDLNDDYLGSGSYFNKALNKYSERSFKKEILFQFKNSYEAYAKESEIVSRRFLKRKDVYNLITGGKGNKGNKLSKNHKNNISIGQTLKGYISKHGIQNGNILYNKSCESKSISQSKRYTSKIERQKMSRPGKLNGMYGKKHTCRTLTKISKSLKDMKHSDKTKLLWSEQRAGKLNGMYGKGYLLKGSNNGNAKPWKLISPDDKSYFLNGTLWKFCKDNKLSVTLLGKYKNNKVPYNIKFRKTKKESLEIKNNTKGWCLIADPN